MNVDKRWTFLDHLPTSSCKHSLWTTHYALTHKILKKGYFSKIAENFSTALTAQSAQKQKSTRLVWVFLIILMIYYFDQPSKPCLPGHVWPAGQARVAGGHKIGLLLYFFKRDSRATLSDCSWVLTIAHLMSWHKIYFHTLWNCKEAALTDDW